MENEKAVLKRRNFQKATINPEEFIKNFTGKLGAGTAAEKIERFKIVYNGIFHCFKPLAIGLVKHTALKIPEDETIKAVSDVLVASKIKIKNYTPGIIVVTDQNFILVSKPYPFIFRTVSFPLRLVQSTEISREFGVFKFYAIKTASGTISIKYIFNFTLVEAAIKEGISSSQSDYPANP